MNRSTTCLAGFMLVQFEVSIPTGTARVERSVDLASVASQLPPKELVSDGRKQCMAPAVLQPLYNCRKQLHRLLEGSGLKFFGGYMVPQDQADILAAEIDTIKTSFAAAVSDICRELPRHYAEWEQKHPAWVPLFRANRLAEAELRSRCLFEVAMIAMAPPEQPTAAALFVQASSRLVPAFLDDIAGKAERVWETHAKGKGKVTQDGLSAVRALVGRMAAFSLLDPRVSPSVAGYRRVLEAMPRIGPLNSRETSEIGGLLSQLMVPEKILEHGTAVFAGPDGTVPAAMTDFPVSLPLVPESTPIDDVALADDTSDADPIPVHVIPPAHAAPAPVWGGAFF